MTDTIPASPRDDNRPNDDVFRFRLDNRVAIVTGAGKGIGRSIAVAFAEAGADLVITSRTRADLDAVAGQIEGMGRRCAVLDLDATETDRAPEVVDRALAEFGRLDVVVNNAGGSPPRPLLSTSVRMMEFAFHFNVSTAFALSVAAIPHLLADGGSIVNISSAIGRLTDRGMVAYGTAKAALSHMTRLMAAECAPRVRVNAIAVGATRTDALATVLSPEMEAAMVARTPLRRLGRPEDIAAGALFLASDAAAYITGKVLEIDGGIEAPNLPLPLPDLMA